MSNSQGWISLHRKLLENPVFKNYKLLQTFLYCLLKATHEDYQLMIGDQVIDLKKGQLATGRNAIAAGTNLSAQNVRTALSNLEKLGILTIKSTTKFSIISISNWDSYQGTNKQVTNGQQTANKQPTTNNNTNNTNNINKGKPILIPSGINFDAWNEWVAYRKKEKTKISKTAATKQFKLLLKYSSDDQQLIINKSIESDYQGLFALKENNNEKNSGNNNFGSQGTAEKIATAISNRNR